jgi:hypothetical protein
MEKYNYITLTKVKIMVRDKCFDKQEKLVPHNKVEKNTQ